MTATFSIARMRPITILLSMALVGLVYARAASAADNRAPDLGDCDKLQVEEGHKVAYYAHAIGFQVYGWNGTSWVFLRPDAVLYANRQARGVIGSHYAGPTWETNSGSYVIGTVLDRCTPDPTAIPWLLLGAVDTGGPGPLARITYIQRVNTVGGTAPATPGTALGEIARVPYTADYYFYCQHD